MAKCIHEFEPSDQCPYCFKERHDMQFGGIYSGDVGLSYRGKGTTKLGLKEAKEEAAIDPEVQSEAVKEFVLKSFTTEHEPDIEDNE
tara:strand:- start:560 stop:820 length:261 start_codon:yes stop_codon:yes gene_type:complete